MQWGQEVRRQHAAQTTLTLKLLRDPAPSPEWVDWEEGNSPWEERTALESKLELTELQSSLGTMCVTGTMTHGGKSLSSRNQKGAEHRVIQAGGTQHPSSLGYSGAHPPQTSSYCFIAKGYFAERTSKQGGLFKDLFLTKLASITE